MFTRLLPVAAVVAALLPALGQATPLAFDQALILAAERSQAARAARAGAAGAAEAARAAGQLPDPMLSAGLENVPVTGPDRFNASADFMTMKRIGISQEWVSSDKRALRQAAAQAQVGRESVMAQVAAADARLQVALAYLDAYYAAKYFELTELTEHHVHEEFEAARARLSSSTGTSQEVLALTSARGVAEDDSADAQQTRAAALVALHRWVGFRPDTLAQPQVPQFRDEQAYVEAHPSVLAAQRDIDVARGDAAVTASNRKPNWTWQVSYAQRTNFSDMASIGVSIPLPVSPGNRQDRETAAKLALVEKAEANLEDAKRLATTEFESLSSDAGRLLQRIERYQQGVVAPAQQRTEAALAGYRSNQVTLMTLFEARHMEVDARRKLLVLQRDLAKVQAQLAFKPVQTGGAQ